MKTEQNRDSRKRAPGRLGLSANFVRAGQYPVPVRAGGRYVRESALEGPDFPYTERHLQCVWFDPAWRPTALRSQDGEDITVLEPGRWNLEAGPDFLDAELSIGPGHRRIRGDVEIHVRPGDWRQHAHAIDPRYARVVAHVCYMPGVLPADALPHGAVQISLRDALKANPTFGFESIDLTAYPYATLTAAHPPCGAAVASLSPEDRTGLLEAAGEQRLRIKAERIALNIVERGEAQAFYEETMAALGFKHNRAPFRQLARLVPLDLLRKAAGGDPTVAYAILLGAAGLLPAGGSMRWTSDARGFARRLWDIWWKQQSRWPQGAMPRTAWRLAGVRPPNHPVRRLAAAASLFGCQARIESSLAALDTRNPSTWFEDACALLDASARMEYWNRRLSIGGPLQPEDIALLGSARMFSMLTNVVIPFLAATGVAVRPLLDRLPPEEDNRLMRETAFALFGRDHNPAVFRTGLRQQGLLQIFHDFCLNRRTGCDGCRLLPALHAAGPPASRSPVTGSD